MITATQMRALTIEVQEPFAAFLGGDPEETRFHLSLLDIVRFAGHACPSMIGAFLVSQKATELLFPDTKVCVRGDVSIKIPNPPTSGPFGPISNVFSYVFGAFEKTGFGGLQGQFIRKDLLQFQVPEVPPGHFRFENTQTKLTFDISYQPGRLAVDIDPSLPFAIQWRLRITEILKNPEKVLVYERKS